MRAPWLLVLFAGALAPARGQDPELVKRVRELCRHPGDVDAVVDPELELPERGSAPDPRPPAGTLQALAAALGGELVTLPGGVLFLTRRAAQAPLRLRGDDPRALLQELARRCGRNLLLGPGVAPRLVAPLSLDVEPPFDPEQVAADLARRAGVALVADEDAWVALPARAPVEAAPVTSAQLPWRASREGPRVSLDVSGLDLADACDQVGRQANRNVLVEPDVSERVSVCLSDVPWQAAVEALARMTRCRVEERPGGILLLTRPLPVAYHARRAPLRPWLALLAAEAGLNLVLGPGVEGEVTCDLRDLHPARVLTLTLAAHGLRREQSDDDLVVHAAPGASTAPGDPQLEARLAEVTRRVEARDAAGLERALAALQAWSRARPDAEGPDGLPALRVQATLTGDPEWLLGRDGAVVDGRVLREGDPVLDGAGEEVPGLRLVQLRPDRLGFRREDVFFERPLPEPPGPAPSRRRAPPPEDPPPGPPDPGLPEVEEPPGPAAPPELGAPPARDPAATRVNVDVEQADLRDLMQQIGEVVGQRIAVAPEVQETVTVSLHDIPWREAVDVIARMTRCTVREEGGGLLLLQVPAISLALEDAELAAVLATIGRLAGRPVLVAPDVRARVSLDLKEVPWDRALELVTRAAGVALHAGERVALVTRRPLPAGLVPGPASEARVALRLCGADLLPLLERLGRAAELPWEASDLGGRAWISLGGVTPREAFLALVVTCGLELAARPPGLQLSGTAAAPPPPPRGDPRAAATLARLGPLARAGATHALADRGRRLLALVRGEDPDAAERRRQEAEAEAAVEGLLGEVELLARESQVEELVQKFTELRSLVSERGTAPAWRALARWERRLAERGEVLLSIRLQLHLSDGARILSRMEQALREQRPQAALDLWPELEQVVEGLRGEEREVFHRNAEALFLRGRSLRDDAGALLAWAPPPDLRGTWVLGEERVALLGGREARAGDELEGGARVIEVGDGWVRLRREDRERLVAVEHP